MIIKPDGSYEVYSIYPNTNWTGNPNYFILDETTPEGYQMSKTYIDNYPLVTFDHHDGYVIGVSVIELMKPPEVDGKTIEIIKNEQGEWEYIYVDIPKPEPDRVAILEARNKAIVDRQEFIEELIAELAMMVYD